MSDEDAIQLDSYLDRLLAGPDAGPAALDALPAVEVALASTAVRLRTELVRFHPSFRFEERLARRLLEVAEAQLRGSVVEPDRSGEPVALAAAGGVGARGIAARRVVTRGLSSPRSRGAADDGHRGLLLGGAIASGVIASGVSLAGAGLVAWRRARTLHRWERLF